MSNAPTIEPYQMLIDGRWVDSSDGETFETSDPYTGKVWATLPRAKDRR